MGGGGGGGGGGRLRSIDSAGVGRHVECAQNEGFGRLSIQTRGPSISSYTEAAIRGVDRALAVNYRLHRAGVCAGPATAAG